ncbi:hypothetical protein ACM7HV_26910 [Pseudomonas paraeruginosa]|uniref:Uncharacterized protein n=1 Tax=Pseudomonas aeruginosa TaxID=287 RepID=A0ABD7JZA3_PSEAI|nr:MULTISPECIES: hypothetical protein [Pseudomonas]KFF32232.1 hypothetical protein G039_0331820 [Pseudomonas aeruginosa VRFPA01]KFF32634.1 hypothetical protein G039_0329150 [Pseudomonas aeruginosa VRFPA01]KSL11141.1 hypothetical protein APA44_17735 [Pseudomonas aeruginosa]MCE1080143.1 hypothetical protein [Pseudomonas asiatica]MDM9597115.1 hypothetical protein [Pseudomonas shirazica]
MSDEQERGDPDAIPAEPVADEDAPEYSDEFAAMILAQEDSDFEEIVADDLLALLDQMLEEAWSLGHSRQ